MLIDNIKEADPNKVYGNSLTFNDPNATGEEIIRFINEVPQEIKGLQFYEKSILPPHFGKLTRLDGLLISFGGRKEISDTILNLPIVRLDLRLCSQFNLSLNLFQNATVNKMFIYGDYEYLPEGDYNLPNLEMLYLQSENFTKISDAKHKLPTLKSLYISNCNLNSIPSSFFAGESLESLNVSSTDLQKLPSNLSNCKSLNYLNLSAPLEEGIPDLVDTSLVRFSAYKLTGEDYYHCRLPKTLEIANLQAEGIVNSFPDLSQCTKLRTLSVNNGKTYPKLSQDLSSLRNLTCSSMTKDELPHEMNTAINLETIHLSNCPIKNFPDFLLDCANLTKLQFYDVEIKNLPVDWKTCINMEVLVVKSDLLKVPSLEFVHKFKKLKTFDLSETTKQSFGFGPRAFVASAGQTKKSLLTDKYSLIGKKVLPLSTNSALLKGCLFRPVYYNGGGKNKSLKPQTFLDFCAALGKSKLSQEDKRYFFDLLWKTPTVEELPVLDFPTFLKALNINFRPLSQNLQRRLVREVLLQHFVKMKLVKNPIAFEATDEKFLLSPESKPMLENVRVFLRNEAPDNVKLGLQMLKTGGVPAEMAEELLLIAKTDENAEIRKEAQELLLEVAPPDWSDLIKNQLQFYVSGRNYSKGFFTKKLTELTERTKPKTAAFFGLLLRRKYSQLPGSSTEIDEFLFKIAQSLNIEKKLLNKKAIVFINGTTSWKKTEIKEKLEAIGLKYATKYSKKVTHVLVGKNPNFFDLQRSDIQILIENFLQTYLSQSAPDFLEQAEQEGDTGLADNVVEFLKSEDASSVLVGLQMLKTGGVPDRVLPTLLVLQKSYDDAKVRAAAKKLLERYGPPRWLPLLRSRLIFKSIGKGGKETDNYNRLLKLEKEISTEAASELSLLFYQRYCRGLRFLVKRGAKAGLFHLQAYEAMYDEGCLNLSSGVGYTDWRTRGNLDTYYGSTGMVNMSINFPKDILDIGKITEIDLHNVKVKALPKGITKFVDLKFLDASFNGLKSLPQGLKKLINLENLDLSFNDFTDFPERVVELSGLRKLDLRSQKNKKLEVPLSVAETLPDCEILV